MGVGLQSGIAAEHSHSKHRSGPGTDIFNQGPQSLFVCFWPHCVFVAAHRLLLVAASRDHPLVVVPWLLIVVASLAADTDSRCVGFRSCGAWA